VRRGGETIASSRAPRNRARFVEDAAGYFLEKQACRAPGHCFNHDHALATEPLAGGGKFPENQLQPGGEVIARQFSAIILLALAFPALASPQKSGQTQLGSVPMYGERYISLQKWARAKGFVVQWQPTERVVHVTNRWAKLVFNINSKRASINSSTVWLSSIVPASGDTVYLSERDVFKLLHPILYPEELPRGKRVRTIMIAPGHGGKDPGFQINAHQEKKYALQMAKVLKETLEAAGFKVLLTRDKDVFVDLNEQAAMAARAGADLFIATHYNAALEVEAKGVETYCLTPVGAISTNGGEPAAKAPGHANELFSTLLAYKVHKHTLMETEFADRGLRRANFVVLRQITMPGILIEGGFLSNPFDAEKIQSPTYRRKTARAITDGILSYKRLVERK
jgi:N-acetylmuramoyl-L-alanine amidase